MELNMRGQVALVTGASKGIGKAIAESLASEGVNLAICARGADLLESVAEELQQRHDVRVLPVSADLSSLDGVRSLVHKTVSRFSAIDILVNNAGAIRAGSLFDKPDEDWHTDWSLKVFGYLRLIREIFPLMQARGGGRIVNIIGTAGRQPAAAYIAGGGANAALMNMTKALAEEGGPHGILVNAINPGPIRTERWDTIMSTVAAQRGLSREESEAAWMQGYPLQRPGEPSEVANFAVFLASPLASYMTGTITPVDGGGIRCI